MKAKFSTKTKEAIYNRDQVCILCWDQWHSCHHILFGLSAERTKERNNVDRWVLLCFDCHLSVHSCKSWEWVRQECINYLKGLWN